MLLANRKVVVVGGSSGIGLSTAEMAKREGAEVIIASRNVERLDAGADKLNAIAIPADVTSDASVAKLFRACGPVDHVVLTAGQPRTRPLQAGAGGRRRGYRAADRFLHGQWVCHGIDRLYRRWSPGYLTVARKTNEERTMASEHHGAFIRNVAEVPWREFPNHFGGALSKPLVTPETAGPRHIAYRLSMYQPMAHVARHKHQVQEPIYHVLPSAAPMQIARTHHIVPTHT